MGANNCARIRPPFHPRDGLEWPRRPARDISLLGLTCQTCQNLPNHQRQIVRTDRALPAGSPPSSSSTVQKSPIRAIAPKRAHCSIHGGALACLVIYLDFSPRNSELATTLSRRFLQTFDTHRAEEMHCVDLQERFFNWLAPKVEPEEFRARNRRRFKSMAGSDLRLVGLLDQYRASGAKATDACPLFRAAHSADS